MTLTKSEKEILEQCRGKCRICLADGGCSLQNKLNKKMEAKVK